MTASDILNQWRAVAPVMGHHPKSWLTLLALCEAEAGLARYELHMKLRQANSSSQARRTLQRWEKAGLLTTAPTAARGKGGAHGKIYHATPKLREFLRID